MLYKLRVVSEGNLPVNIKLDASTEVEARRQAEKQGFTVLRTVTVGNQFNLRTQHFPLVLFCQELRVLLEAGLALTDALDTLIEKEIRPETRATMQKLLVSVREGRQISDAMSSVPTAFPSLFVATIRAAETTGNLPEALSRYALYLEQLDILKKRIISASIYPALVLAFGCLVVIFLMGYVVPRFSRIYESHVSHLSATTKLLLNFGKFSQDYGGFILLIIVITSLLLFSLMSRPEVRGKVFDSFWKLPYLGEKVRIYHLSRLYRTFSMLLKSGIPVVTGLNMVNSLLGTTLQSNLTKAKRLISEGKPFSEAFGACGLTTPVATRLFRVGERTGKLETMMERAATFHEEQMLRWVDAFTKLFEPLLMVFIGIVIGGIVLMMYLPIFDLASGLE